jgi:hypothetical protein
MRRTTMMRVPICFKEEIEEISKNRKIPATEFLRKNTGFFKKGEKFRRLLEF